MRYLIFSDSHLTDIFDSPKFKALKEAIEYSDRVILNGDFWEGFTTKFDDFVKSEWSQELFPLLKRKKAVYLYGNHDKKEYANKQVALFSDRQQSSYIFRSGDRTFYVEHGDKLFPLPDINKWTDIVLENIEDLLFKIFRKVFLAIAYGWMNGQIKNKIRGRFKENEFLITGHTHFAEIDLENHYLNPGFVKHGLAQYLYIENGEITAVEKRY